MNAFTDMMKAISFVFVVIVIIVAGSFVGAIIVPVFVVSFFVYFVYLMIQNERDR